MVAILGRSARRVLPLLHAMRFRRISVQRRFNALVVIQAVSAVLLLVIAFSAIGRLVSHTRYTHRFVLEPLSQIGLALEKNASIRAAGGGPPKELLDSVERFAAHYRDYWQLSGSTNPDAIRQIAELREAGAVGLVDAERRVVDELVATTQRLNADGRVHAPPETIELHAREQRAALQQLMEMNIQFGIIARDTSEAITTGSFWMMAVVGAFAVIGATIIGVRTRNAIMPHIRQLVTKVRRFQELGVNEPIPETGSDELTVLSHAIDAGFASIAARNRDRDRFLAVMAHELKTPLSNIRGFARVALERPDNHEVRTRAIEIISRQAERVVRLVEDLFLVSRAHTHELPFVPAPLMLSPLIERIAAEVRLQAQSSDLEVDAKEAAPVLADEALLAQALWTMFTYAVTRAGSLAVRVRVWLSSTEAVTFVEGLGPQFSKQELMKLFEPFASSGYEGASGEGERRNILGLYLCSEIVKVHGGVIRAFNEADGTPALSLSLPI